MPKGQSPKFREAICNFSLDAVSTCNNLPHPTDSNVLVTEKEIGIQESCLLSACPHKFNFQNITFFEKEQPIAL